MLLESSQKLSRNTKKSPKKTMKRSQMLRKSSQIFLTGFREAPYNILKSSKSALERLPITLRKLPKSSQKTCFMSFLKPGSHSLNLFLLKKINPGSEYFYNTTSIAPFANTKKYHIVHLLARVHGGQLHSISTRLNTND